MGLTRAKHFLFWCLKIRNIEGLTKKARILNHDVRCKITIASKTIVFKGVEPQLRHLEPVGWKWTLAHLSVHLHIFVHNCKKAITLTTFDHFWKIVPDKKKYKLLVILKKKKILEKCFMGTSGCFDN